MIQEGRVVVVVNVGSFNRDGESRVIKIGSKESVKVESRRYASRVLVWYLRRVILPSSLLNIFIDENQCKSDVDVLNLSPSHYYGTHGMNVFDETRISIMG